MKKEEKKKEHKEAHKEAEKKGEHKAHHKQEQKHHARNPDKSLIETNKILIENFLALQKVMTGMAEKFDNLSSNIAKLLNLFEASAISFAEKQETGEMQKDKEFLDKLNSLMEQNKTIAKGLTLMEEKLRQKLYGATPTSPETQKPRMVPRF